ncbi:thioredoxin domain-containing protein [Actinocorallia cavernae]|uniref:Thioredoxin domain-containing protein n=3 Tax=Actinomycetota TaxID=201174 RepID=A0ABP8SBY9_9ACTN
MRMKRAHRRLTAVVVSGLLGAAVVSCAPGHQGAADGGGPRQGRGGAGSTSRTEAAYPGLADVPEKVEPDGSTVLVGDPGARMTVRLYEDPRCPVCKEFETEGGGPVLTEWVLRHKAKVEYTMASFLDPRLGGDGSKKAVNALRAALERGKFAEYHAVLYQDQPAEEVDGFTDARLLQLAGKVKGLRSPSFDAAVRSMKYRGFVNSAESAYAAAGHGDGHAGPGTPTAVVNGYQIPVESNGLLFDPGVFGKFLTLADGPSA